MILPTMTLLTSSPWSSSPPHHDPPHPSTFLHASSPHHHICQRNSSSSSSFIFIVMTFRLIHVHPGQLWSFRRWKDHVQDSLGGQSFGHVDNAFRLLFQSLLEGRETSGWKNVRERENSFSCFKDWLRENQYANHFELEYSNQVQSDPLPHQLDWNTPVRSHFTHNLICSHLGD